MVKAYEEKAGSLNEQKKISYRYRKKNAPIIIDEVVKYTKKAVKKKLEDKKKKTKRIVKKKIKRKTKRLK